MISRRARERERINALGLRTLLLVAQSALSCRAVGRRGSVRAKHATRARRRPGIRSPTPCSSSRSTTCATCDSTARRRSRCDCDCSTRRARCRESRTHRFRRRSRSQGTTSWPIFVAGIDSVSALGEFDFNTVSADYFATMGTRILRGRGFEATDIGWRATCRRDRRVDGRGALAGTGSRSAGAAGRHDGCRAVHATWWAWPRTFTPRRSSQRRRRFLLPPCGAMESAGRWVVRARAGGCEGSRGATATSASA